MTRSRFVGTVFALARFIRAGPPPEYPRRPPETGQSEATAPPLKDASRATAAPPTNQMDTNAAVAASKTPKATTAPARSVHHQRTLLFCKIHFCLQYSTVFGEKPLPICGAGARFPVADRRTVCYTDPNIRFEKLKETWTMTLTVPCLFGLESLVADEMRRLDLKNVQAENGRVHCEGTLADIAR